MCVTFTSQHFSSSTFTVLHSTSLILAPYNAVGTIIPSGLVFYYSAHTSEPPHWFFAVHPCQFLHSTPFTIPSISYNSLSPSLTSIRPMFSQQAKNNFNITLIYWQFNFFSHTLPNSLPSVHHFLWPYQQRRVTNKLKNSSPIYSHKFHTSPRRPCIYHSYLADIEQLTLVHSLALSYINKLMHSLALSHINKLMHSLALSHMHYQHKNSAQLLAIYFQLQIFSTFARQHSGKL